jgi:hypothetical protein
MMSLHVVHVSGYTIVDIMTAVHICTLCLLDLQVTSECDGKVLLLDNYPGFEFLRVNIVARIEFLLVNITER